MKLCYSCMQQIEDEQAEGCPICGERLDISNEQKYLQPGTILQGKFIIGKVIGAGGFGNTYIAWNRLLLCKVAIKEFYPSQYVERQDDGTTVHITDPRMEERFQNGLHQFLAEAKSVASLQDIKGVVSIYNFFEANGTGYYVMEYLEGRDVKSILEYSDNVQTYDWGRRVVLTVLDILKDVHKRGILHRDIAPDNIFVTNEGVIKLIDFGAAKHATEADNSNKEIMLKVGYAPIEQYSRTAEQGPYTDLYAVAALFYRMLTGKKPQAANKRLQEDQVKSLSELGIDIPDQAECAIMICLSIQPEYRLPSAEKFMEALDGQDFVPVYEPKWIMPPEPTEKKTFLQKIKALPVVVKVAAIVLCICLLGGTIFTIVQITKKDDAIKTLSTNASNIMVELQGKSLSEAKVLVQSLGLTINDEEITYVPSTAVPMYGVLSQSIQAGTSIKPGQTLSVVLSGGDNLLTMPDCSTMSLDECKSYFSKYGVEVVVGEPDYSDEIEKDALLSQSVAKKSVLDLSSGTKTIELTYSLGSESLYTYEMPDITDMTIEEAQQEMDSLYSDNWPAGTVKVVKYDSRYDDDYEKGRIDYSIPGFLDEINIRDNQEIWVIISKGKKRAKN